MAITKLTTAIAIQTARTAFEENVTTAVYNEHFASIGQGFKVMALIGTVKKNTYIKCEREGKVIGLAYGHPKGESDSNFYIADIISAPKSGSGSELCAWFCVKDNVGMPNLRIVSLTAANSDLQGVYAKPQYGFVLKEASTGSMEKVVG